MVAGLLVPFAGRQFASCQFVGVLNSWIRYAYPTRGPVAPKPPPSGTRSSSGGHPTGGIRCFASYVVRQAPDGRKPGRPKG